MTRISARFVGSAPDFRVIRSLFRDRDGAVGRDLDERARRVLARARILVGVRSGTLLASGRREAGVSAAGQYRDVTFGVRGVTDYLGYHHYGTGRHVIRPRRRKALRFVSGGRIIFATKVNHPGSAGTRFLVRALDAAR